MTCPCGCPRLNRIGKLCAICAKDKRMAEIRASEHVESEQRKAAKITQRTGSEKRRSIKTGTDCEDRSLNVSQLAGMAQGHKRGSFKSIWRTA